MPTPTETPAPSANGELINRVQQLRLAGQLGTGGSGGNRGAWLPWVLCAMMAVTWAGVGVRWYKVADPGAKGQAAVGSGTGSASPGSENQSVVKPGELVLQVKGILVPALQINVSTDDVSGTVTEIFFKEGEQVKKGHRLAEIRKDRFQNDCDALKAGLDAAEARLADLGKEAVRPEERKQVEAELNEAKASQERSDLEVKRLTAPRGTGVVSQEVLEKADTDLKAASARVDRLRATLALLNMGARNEKIAAAKADVAQAQSRYSEAQRVLKNCTVVAPIDGTILTKVADKGVLVSPMSFNVASGICSMADLSDLEAEIEVREDQITGIEVGQECQVMAAANPARMYVGRVDRIMPIADDTKNVIKVRVKVKLPTGEDPGSFLKPKMTTTVRVYEKQIADFTVVQPNK